MYLYILGSKNNCKPFQQNTCEKTTSSPTLNNSQQLSSNSSKSIHTAGKIIHYFVKQIIVCI